MLNSIFDVFAKLLERGELTFRVQMPPAHLSSNQNRSCSIITKRQAGKLSTTNLKMFDFTQLRIEPEFVSIVDSLSICMEIKMNKTINVKASLNVIRVGHLLFSYISLMHLHTNDENM